jgi:cell shape-determining protein MreC
VKLHKYIVPGILIFLFLLFLNRVFVKNRVDIFSFFPSYNICEADEKVRYYREIHKVRQEIAILSWQLIKAKEKIRNLTTFREKFSIEKIPYVITASIIIRRDSSNPRKSFVIDKGYSDGIKAGANVIYGHSLVGKVVEVGKYVSRILHIKDPAMRISIKLISKFKEKIYNYGSGICKGGKYCSLELVEKGYMKWVTPKMMVLTSGFNGEYLSNLIIGTVTLPRYRKKLKKKNFKGRTGLFWDLPVKIMDLNKMNTVLVVIKP